MGPHPMRSTDWRDPLGPTPTIEPLRPMQPPTPPRGRRTRLTALATAAILAMALVVVFVTTRSEQEACHVTVFGSPSCGIWWGAALHATNSALPATVSSAQSATGRRLDIVHTYHRWFDDFPTAAELTVVRSGDQLMVNWEPVDQSGQPMEWAAIADGRHDSQIDVEAARLRAVGRTIFISFSHEPELHWGSHGTAAQFAAAFRHVVSRTRADGATNVRWVWDLMGLSGATWHERYKAMWPGEAAVSWVAWDPYNWASCGRRSWKSFSQTVTSFYDWLRSNGFGIKPFMLAEYGTVEDPSRPNAKAGWLAGVPEALKKLPDLKALLYFDLPSPPANCDWSVTTSTKSAMAYDALAHTPAFASSARIRLAPG